MKVAAGLFNQAKAIKGAFTSFRLFRSCHLLSFSFVPFEPTIIVKFLLFTLFFIGLFRFLISCLAGVGLRSLLLLLGLLAPRGGG